ncbi:hypothetical protein HYT92_03200 [Candidatus Pacearchaeota archaeon]|nr:hypothetical protein [Candidatus Pacearchaeota archaeon]
MRRRKGKLIILKNSDAHKIGDIWVVYGEGEDGDNKRALIKIVSINDNVSVTGWTGSDWRTVPTYDLIRGARGRGAREYLKESLRKLGYIRKYQRRDK